MHDHLRSSPIYQDALRTGSVLGEAPANSYYVRRRDEAYRDDFRVQSAGRKLDHLIRRALDPDYSYIGTHEISAIMAFLAEFDRTFPNMRITESFRHWIDAKIAFCRQLIEASLAECEAHGWHPPSANRFSDFVIREGETLHEIVYHNPFYSIYFLGTPTHLYFEISANYWK